MPNEIKDEPTKGRPENPAAATASSEKRGDKYQRILEAAVEVIAEHGFFNARVSDIAQRAGVADGTIYLYFKSKDQILMAAISNAFGAFLELARAEVKSASEPRDQLRRLALLHLTSLGSNRNLAIVFQTELRQSARFLAQFSQHQLKQYFDLIREVVRKGQDQGVFRGDLSDKIVANCFFGSLDEMVTSWLLSERDYSLPGAADAVVDVILGGVETRRPS
ncbi:MAG TPA: TetR/AcrR family transcriptional regulator [Terriglobales bacterium]|nr:TetR/AcrR family transcriptional regulator [Terriglobales bacterium]